MPGRRTVGLIVLAAIVIAIIALLVVRARPTGGLTPVGFSSAPATAAAVA